MNGRVALMPRFLRRIALAAATACLCAATVAHAAERVTLTNGYSLICDHHAEAGESVRLYLDPRGQNYIEVSADRIASVTSVPVPVADRPSGADSARPSAPAAGPLTRAELRPMLSRAGHAHDIDVDLLASVVREESGGRPRAASRAGAEGLMQLMPGTASHLGVANAFAPSENIRGGTTYLDRLLTRYHNNLALALAAYNAGPAAVDRWHGIPPYPETRQYVARVIREFNRLVEARHSHAQVVAAAVQ